jgi:predicted PurR-regulated permease PerM
MRSNDQPGAWTAMRVRASGSSILLAVCTLVVVYLTRDLFVAATQPLGWVAAAAALALVIGPVVAVPARVIPRFLAVIVTLIVGAVIVVSIGAGLFVQVQAQLELLGEQLPAAAEELERDGGDSGVLADMRFAALVEDLVDQTSERLSPEPTVEDAAGTAPAFFLSAVLTIFIMLWARRMFEAFQRQISDDARRERITRVVESAVRLTQRYLVGAVPLAMVVGALAGSVAWIVGMPTPLVLGVVVAVAALVPYVGVLFGGLPMVILAAALEPARTTLLIVGTLVALQAASTVVTRSVIEPRSFRVGPAIIVVAALVGSDVYGIGGAFVVTVAGIVAMALIEASRRDGRSARAPHPFDDHHAGHGQHADPDEDGRDEQVPTPDGTQRGGDDEARH